MRQWWYHFALAFRWTFSVTWWQQAHLLLHAFRIGIATLHRYIMMLLEQIHARVFINLEGIHVAELVRYVVGHQWLNCRTSILFGSAYVFSDLSLVIVAMGQSLINAVLVVSVAVVELHILNLLIWYDILNMIDFLPHQVVLDFDIL